MESEHAFVKLKAHRIGETGCMSGVYGDSLKGHRVEFLRYAFVVENISCGYIAISMLSLIRDQWYDNE